MFNPDILLAQIKNNEEALIIISALGNYSGDWSFIKNIGGPLKVLKSDLFIDIIKNKIQTFPHLIQQWDGLREKLDYFYSQKGFLCTPLDKTNTRLFKIPNAPLVFFGRFNPSCMKKMTQVAVVGARDACENGLNWSRSLSSHLASRNINVISGGALGIDHAAHQGALNQHGTTCVVSGLACSLRDKAQNIAREYDHDRMAIIYPFGPFFPQAKYMFVERNKYVVALADALIVVQGREGSGTLHTVKFAETQKIPIYAVPGAVNNPLSYVPNMLLQNERARAIADFEQITQAIVTNGTKAPKKQKKATDLIANTVLSESLPELLLLIKNNGNSLSMPEILALSGKSFSAMQKELLEFELAGRIIKQGAQFVLTGR